MNKTQRLEQIDARIKAEQERVYYLTKSPDPFNEIQIIISNVTYLMRLRDQLIKGELKI